MGVRQYSHKKRLCNFRDVLSRPTQANVVSIGFQRYELEKLQWASQHPEATPAEYSKAMLEIARRAGI